MVLGVNGARTGVINSVNSEVSQNKLATVRYLLHQLDKPIEENFRSIAQLTVSMASLIPWMQCTESQDSHTLAEAIIALGRNTSSTFMCIQAQTWYLGIIKDIVLQGMEGCIPLEVQNLLMTQTKQS